MPDSDDTPPAPGSPGAPLVLRLPRTAYLVVLFLVFGTVPLAFAGSTSSLQDSSSGNGSTGTEFGPRLLLLLIPLLAALFIARTATVVDATGVRVRALLGSRRMSWDEIFGLSVSGRAVYAVLGDGAVRLPCVRLANIGTVSRASGGRLPELKNQRARPAPSRRRR